MSDILNQFFQQLVLSSSSVPESGWHRKYTISLKEVRALSGEQLLKWETHDSIADLINDIVFSNEYSEAKALSFVLDNKILQINKGRAPDQEEIIISYEKMISMLKYYAIALLSTKDIIKIFSQELISLVNSGFDIRQRLEWIFNIYEDDIEEGILRRDLLKAIRENQDQMFLGTSGLKNNKGGALETPFTVAQLVREYDAYTKRDPTRMRTGVERATFIAQDAMVKILPLAKRDLIVKLLEIYDWLIYERVIPEWVKDIEYDSRQASGIQIGKEAKRELSLNITDRLIKKYETWRKDAVIQASLKLLDEYMSKSAPLEASGLEGVFLNSINHGETPQAIAALWAIGHGKAVKTFIGNSSRYQRYWEHQIEKSQIPNPKSQIEEFKQDPAAAKHLLAFLKHILIERLKLPEESAKLVVLTLSNEARKAGEEEYAHLAYGDLETGEFKWGT